MGDAGFFKGTSADQDARFSDKQKKLLRSMRFPSEFNQKIDMKKVNLKVIKGWMAQRISQLLGIEDEVVVEYASGMLEDDVPDPKMMQINLQGFLDKNSQVFVLELWKLLISAQKSLGGIPQQFLDQTKQELLQAKRIKESELAKVKEQEEKERAVAEEVRKKAQAIRDASRPKASSLGNGLIPGRCFTKDHATIATVGNMTEGEKDMVVPGAGMGGTHMTVGDIMKVEDTIDTGIEAGTGIEKRTGREKEKEKETETETEAEITVETLVVIVEAAVAVIVVDAVVKNTARSEGVIKSSNTMDATGVGIVNANAKGIAIMEDIAMTRSEDV
ncbi:hypothetical protein BGZ58_007824, partial [Dissophora ornata]